MSAAAAVFLDRDGVINKALVRDGKPYPPRAIEEFELLPGVREGLENLKLAGFCLIVVTNQQLYIALGIPLLFNATLIVVLIAFVNAKFHGMEAKIDGRLDAIDKRFDDMRDLWRAELHRVEEVLDARLKHIEDRG